MHAPDSTSSRNYARMLEDVAVIDLSDVGLLSCTGKDAARFLHNLCTNDIVKLPANKSCEAFFTTAQAKIVAYANILNVGSDEPAFLINVGAGAGPRVFEHLNRFWISEEIEFENVTDAFDHVHVAGPRARLLIRKMLGEEFEPMAESNGEGMVSGDKNVRVWKRNRFGLPGYDLLWRRSEAPTSIRELDAHPRISAESDACECFRIEAGVPRFGIDITEANLPQEVGRIEQTISFTKGCYIGQETVARIRSLGHVNRTLRGFVLNGAHQTAPGAKLFHEAAEAGTITSSVLSPRLDRTIALAYIRRGRDEAQTVLTVGEPGSTLTGIVTDLPFLPTVNEAT